MLIVIYAVGSGKGRLVAYLRMDVFFWAVSSPTINGMGSDSVLQRDAFCFFGPLSNVDDTFMECHKSSREIGQRNAQAVAGCAVFGT